MKQRVWIGLWIFIGICMLAASAGFFKIPFDEIPFFIRLICIAISPITPIGWIILAILDDGYDSPGLLKKTWDSLGQNTVLTHLEAKRLIYVEQYAAIVAFLGFGGISAGGTVGKVCFVLLIVFTPISLGADKVLKNAKIEDAQ